MLIKEKIYEIIFEADTKTGKIFDVFLLIFITLSVGFVMLESIPSIAEIYCNKRLTLTQNIQNL